MKYFILITGILSIFIVTILNFYPEESKGFIQNLFNDKEYVIAKANDYYLEGNFDYVQNWTDDVSNKQELLNYYNLKPIDLLELNKEVCLEDIPLFFTNSKSFPYIK